MTSADGGQSEETSTAVGSFCMLLLLASLLFCVGVVRGPSLTLVDGGIRSGLNEALVASIYVFALAVALAAVHARSGATRPCAEDRPLCTHCIRPFRDGAHFCPRCASPLTTFATTASYESAYAQTWLLGKAVKYPRRPLHVLGVAAIAAPALIGVPLLLAMGSWLDEDFYTVEALGSMGAIFYAHALLMLYCWRNWRRYVRDPDSAPAESEYGCPPWWTYDRWWTLPEDEPDAAAPGDERPAEASP